MRSGVMPKRGSRRKFALKGEKECWHPYSLQALSTRRFTVVVGRILTGRYELIPPRADRQIQHSHSA